jgi:hypothetical protein
MGPQRSRATEAARKSQTDIIKNRITSIGQPVNVFSGLKASDDTVALMTRTVNNRSLIEYWIKVAPQIALSCSSTFPKEDE